MAFNVWFCNISSVPSRSDLGHWAVGLHKLIQLTLLLDIDYSYFFFIIKKSTCLLGSHTVQNVHSGKFLCLYIWWPQYYHVTGERVELELKSNQNIFVKSRILAIISKQQHFLWIYKEKENVLYTLKRTLTRYRHFLKLLLLQLNIHHIHHFVIVMEMTMPLL